MGSATRHRTHSKPTPLPGWVWLATGLAIGLFVAFLVYLGRMPGTVGESELALPVEEAVVTPDNAKTAQAAKPEKTPPAPPLEALEPEFGFYTELLTMEVEVPVDEPLEAAPIARPSPKIEPAPASKDEQQRSAPATAPPTKAKHVYVLQLPSFKSYRAADSLKARLALMGVESSIQTVSVGSKEKWFRVRVGPYPTSAEASAIQQRLRRQQVPSVLLKLSK